ncbi:hypothetical protein [Lentibacillus sp. Marseille-P4043]|uniref:hypothetical protein n=1 Tax=Lentibacillus sp. Marseille-P4043 TaxID=2040293 RepID=UPI000D0B16D7|nr:hypothetical protein [Lentibacillus sp. Marseille-P4043]
MHAENMEASPTLAAIIEDFEKRGLERGLEKGLKKGKKEGYKEAMNTFAKKLIHDAFPDEKIEKLTELLQEDNGLLRKSQK